MTEFGKALKAAEKAMVPHVKKAVAKVAERARLDALGTIELEWCKQMPGGSAVGMTAYGEVWMGDDWVHFRSTGYMHSGQYMGEPDALEQTRDESRAATVLWFKWGHERAKHTVDDMLLMGAESRRCVVKPRVADPVVVPKDWAFYMPPPAPQVPQIGDVVEYRQNTETVCSMSGESFMVPTTKEYRVNGGAWTAVPPDPSTIVGVAMESGNAGDTIKIRFDGDTQSVRVSGGWSASFDSEPPNPERAWLDRRVNEMVRLGRKAVA